MMFSSELINYVNEVKRVDHKVYTLSLMMYVISPNWGMLVSLKAYNLPQVVN